MDFKFFRKLLAAVIFIAGFSGLPLSAEYVFLKDGSILQGKIVSDSAASVTLRLDDKKTRNIQRPLIMRILYTELYMGKVYVQKVDGKNVICYMVDEDRESYTFRKELYNPGEFMLRRDEVLFMARGNPSGLSGDAETTELKLKWFAPYNPVKRYRIYVKGPDDTTYRSAAESREKETTLRGLKSNTLYFLYVTALDESGDESLPSNELKITTKNINPEKPAGVRSAKKESDDGKSFSALLTWQPSTDPDGRITAYEIWDRTGGDRLIASVKDASYPLMGLNPELKYNYAIRAVDDKGGMSGFSTTAVALVMPFQASVRGGVYIPLGDMRDFTKTGYGSLISMEFSLPWFREIFVGIETGCVYFPGNLPGIDGMIMVPCEFRAAYHYEKGDWMFAAVVSMGASWSSMEYYTEKDSNGSPVTLTAKAFDPSGAAGINASWVPINTIVIGAVIEYRSAFEKKGMLNYFGGGLSCGYRF